MIEGSRVIHEARYPHPPERVWQALTDRAELAADFARCACRCVADEADPSAWRAARLASWVALGPVRTRVPVLWTLASGDPAQEIDEANKKIDARLPLKVEHHAHHR